MYLIISKLNKMEANSDLVHYSLFTGYIHKYVIYNNTRLKQAFLSKEKRNTYVFRVKLNGADEENRTPVVSLEG